ncbi:MAG: hypothetical protein ACRD43_11515, partial [Pyrinomonadaceae bacterium]
LAAFEKASNAVLEPQKTRRPGGQKDVAPEATMILWARRIDNLHVVTLPINGDIKFQFCPVGVLRNSCTIGP